MKELIRILFTSIILTITLNCFGQNINFASKEKILLTEIENVLEKKSVEDLLKFKKIKCGAKNECSHVEKTNLIETYYHNIVRIQVEYSIDESRTSFYGYDISIINFDNEIIYYNILDIGIKRKVKYKNLLKLAELQSSYSQFYFEQLKIEDLETYDKYTYGISCGWGGETLEERAEMEKHLTKKDISFFNTWISKPSVELKAYAYEAFRRLEKNGIKLSEKHIKILQYLENNNSNVRTCEGCIGESIEMKELIKTIKIE